MSQVAPPHGWCCHVCSVQNPGLKRLFDVICCISGMILLSHANQNPYWPTGIMECQGSTLPLFTVGFLKVFQVAVRFGPWKLHGREPGLQGAGVKLGVGLGGDLERCWHTKTMGNPKEFGSLDVFDVLTLKETWREILMDSFGLVWSIYVIHIQYVVKKQVGGRTFWCQNADFWKKWEVLEGTI